MVAVTETCHHQIQRDIHDGRFSSIWAAPPSALVDPSVSVGFTTATESAIAALGDPLTANAFVVSGRPYGFNPNAVAVPFAAVGVAFLSAYTLVLDLSSGAFRFPGSQPTGGLSGTEVQ